ncbi:MAG TPA: hypothetical protein PLQ41_05055, partial [bacterium]|nr:hypothetical protein [bacterium]
KFYLGFEPRTFRQGGRAKPDCATPRILISNYYYFLLHLPAKFYLGFEPRTFRQGGRAKPDCATPRGGIFYLKPQISSNNFVRDEETVTTPRRKIKDTPCRDFI